MRTRTRRTPAGGIGQGSQSILSGDGCTTQCTARFRDLADLESRRLLEMARRIADHETRLCALEADIERLEAEVSRLTATVAVLVAEREVIA